MEGASGAHHRDPFKSSGELSLLSFRALQISVRYFLFLSNFSAVISNVLGFYVASSKS